MKDIEELVKELDKVLEGHNLTFDEYLLAKAIHEYENRSAEEIKAVKEKNIDLDHVEKRIAEFLAHRHHKKHGGDLEALKIQYGLAFMTARGFGTIRGF